MAKQNAQPTDSLPPAKTTWLLITLTFISMLGGFLFGYDLGIIGGAMLIMRNRLDLDDIWQELIISMTSAGAAVSSLAGGFLNTKFGRKYTILGSSLLFIVGAVLSAASPTKEILLVGRVLYGVATGLSSCTVTAYVSECSPNNIRGRMLTLYQFLLSSGGVVAGILAAGLSYINDPNLNWRLMLGLAGVPAAIQFIGMCFMPESPRWLATHDREEEAFVVMKRIYGNDEIAQKNAIFELQMIKDSEAEAKREREMVGAESQFPLFTIIRMPHLLKAVVIGCSLLIFQQLCGINSVFYYSATIMMMTGVNSPSVAIWLAIMPSLVSLFASCVGVYLVEKIGRRSLTLFSVFSVFISLLILGAAFTVIAAESPDSVIFENSTTLANDTCRNLNCDTCSYQASCGFCYEKGRPTDSGSCFAINTYQGPNGDGRKWASDGRCSRNFTESTDPVHFPFVDPDAVWNYGFCPTSLSCFPILGLVLFLVSFAVGFGPMPWTINAELYPNWVRSTGTALASFCNWTCNIIVSLTFLTLSRAITHQGAYFLYAGITLIGLVWFYLVLPETKNKDIEEIQFSLMGPWFNRGRVEVITKTKMQLDLDNIGAYGSLSKSTRTGTNKFDKLHSIGSSELDKHYVKL